MAADVVRATVVKTEPGVLTHGFGKGKLTNTVQKRTWSDGLVDFKCADCEFAHENFQSVFSHRGAHVVRKSREELDSIKAAKAGSRRGRAASDPLLVVTEMVADAASLLDKAMELLLQTKQDSWDESAPWRTRAQAAEKELKSIKKMFGRLADIPD